jgi:hypothetical protein
VEVRTHKAGFAPVPIENVYDFNRYRRVSATDELTPRDRATTDATALQLLHLTAGAALLAMADPSAAGDSSVPEVSLLTTAAVPAVQSVGSLPARMPTATDAAFALASPAWPEATAVPLVAPPTKEVAPRVTNLAPAAAHGVDPSALDHLTMLLALERSATELSAQRHLRAIDALLAEGTSLFADSPDVSAPTKTMRRRAGFGAVSM